MQGRCSMLWFDFAAACKPITPASCTADDAAALPACSRSGWPIRCVWHAGSTHARTSAAHCRSKQCCLARWGDTHTTPACRPRRRRCARVAANAVARTAQGCEARADVRTCLEMSARDVPRAATSSLMSAACVVWSVEFGHDAGEMKTSNSNIQRLHSLTPCAGQLPAGLLQSLPLKSALGRPPEREQPQQTRTACRKPGSIGRFRPICFCSERSAPADVSAANTPARCVMPTAP